MKFKTSSRLFPISLAFSLALIAGCRGGETPGVVPPQSSSGSASFNIVVPAASKNAGPAMQSVSVSVVAIDGRPLSGAPVTSSMNLFKSVPGCSALAGGALSCTARISAPAGRDSFIVTTYAQPNLKGAAISTSRVTTTISAGRTTSCAKKPANRECAVGSF